nr:serine hydrolase domain-containing protein [uncultured Psychroserpens sp.]
MKRIYLLGLIVFTYQSFSQNNTLLEQKFDSILSQWDDATKPGLTAGVIKNGKLLYLKGFGVADIESKELITPKTKFQVDDLAKQFTVLGILLLEHQGKLSFEDDIRNYLPELPQHQAPIKIKHLLNHSSGLYTLDPIKELMGIRNNDLFTQEDALKIIRSQKQLNYLPGTAFSYHRSDTEIILMVEIISKASGKSFIEYAKDEIFKPLEMLNTSFNIDRKMLPSLAKSYTIAEDISYNPINDLTLGATNLYTTGEDLAKWFQAFYKDGALFKIIQQLDKYVSLDASKVYASTWGKMTLGRYFDHPERGLDKMSWQYGLKGGYACNLFRFQSHNFISFVLGNNNRYNGMPTMQMAYQVLETEFTEPVEIDYSKIAFKSLSNKKLKNHEGIYWDKTNGIVREISVKNDSLRYIRLESNRETPLLALSNQKFQFYVSGDTEIFITFYDDHFLLSSLGSDASRYDKIDPIQMDSKALEDYTGIFYNEALNISYTFSVEDDILIATNFKTGATSFYPILNDHFRSNTYMLSGINFTRNSNNKVDGFSINTDGVKDLRFKKMLPL